MKKILIENCRDCATYYDGGCNKTIGEINTAKTIPDDCPLEDDLPESKGSLPITKIPGREETENNGIYDTALRMFAGQMLAKLMESISETVIGGIAKDAIYGKKLERLIDEFAAFEPVSSVPERKGWIQMALPEKVFERLIELYPADYVCVAKICDEVLDRSGALLGIVRKFANLPQPPQGEKGDSNVSQNH
jgi:hypothetical protein